MKAAPKTVHAPGSGFDKPAKERIAEEANNLFRIANTNVSMDTIALFAETSVATIIKHFGTRERLVFDFLKSLMKQAEQSWREIEQEHPNDPEAQLRKWVLHSEISADPCMQDEYSQLSRAAVDLIGFVNKSPLLTEIEKFWQDERRKVAKLCEQAKFRDPSGLADKLLLLVHGARNERNCYGFAGPSQKVGEAGDDLMVAHGAQRKPLLEI
jgi:AcrR family transcriptional regulator